MDRETLIQRHPTLYHMADARNWPSIQRLGLLSTSAILDAFGLLGEERSPLESGHRPLTVRLPAEGKHPTRGVVYVRDQKPLEPDALAVCLDEISPVEWRRTLNRRVFFWPTVERLEKMLKVYLREEQMVFEVETAKLLDRHGDRVELSHINSGFASSRYRPARRGRSTFASITDYDGSKKNTIAELTVLHSVPDILEITTRVTGRQRGRPDREIWPTSG